MVLNVASSVVCSGWFRRRVCGSKRVSTGNGKDEHTIVSSVEETVVEGGNKVAARNECKEDVEKSIARKCGSSVGGWRVEAELWCGCAADRVCLLSGLDVGLRANISHSSSHIGLSNLQPQLGSSNTRL